MQLSVFTHPSHAGSHTPLMTAFISAFVCLGFLCSNSALASNSPVLLDVGEARKEGVAVKELSPETDSTGSNKPQAQRQLPPRVLKIMEELKPADARALLGAFKQGYIFVRQLDDGFVLARKIKATQSASNSSSLVADVDFIISFNKSQLNKRKKAYVSVISMGAFQCRGAQIALVYQQFQAGSFGTGERVSAHESLKPVRFRPVTKGLGEFLSSVYC